MTTFHSASSTFTGESAPHGRNNNIRDIVEVRNEVYDGTGELGGILGSSNTGRTMGDASLGNQNGNDGMDVERQTLDIEATADTDNWRYGKG